MAEGAVGLAVGLVALAGTLNDCVELLGYISAIRSFDQESEIISTKLDIQRLRLLQWADRVELLNDKRRSGDTAAWTCIERILVNLQRMLSNSKELQRRYGLCETSSSKTDDEQMSATALLGQQRMDDFVNRLKDQLQIGKSHPVKSNSLVKKTKWALRDKHKFGDLVSDISELINGLNEVLPDGQQITKRMMREDLANIRSIRTLNAILDATTESKQLQQIANVAEDLLVERAASTVIDSLWFRSIEERKSIIDLAHQKTFDWAFHPPMDDQWTNLSEWLESGNGVYWIQGKPGSGKSTLMKYILTNTQTEWLLKRWGGTNVAMIDFFFYGLGASEQKTQEGLYRSLLFQIFTCHRSLVSQLLPKTWHAVYRSVDEECSRPSMAEIKQALIEFGKIVHNDRKCCFFIDGLDEFEGDLTSSLALLMKLAANTSIKLLVSSRPISQCHEAFSKMAGLRLQDLTRGDITTYVKDTVTSHLYVSQLEDAHPGSVEMIIKELQEKACGVFLWVILACRSLLQGFASYDRLEDLRRRIDALPPELEDLFQHILGRIDKVYRDQAARLLHVAFYAQLSNLTPRIPALSLAIFEENDLKVSKVGKFCKLSRKEQAGLLKILGGRLISRCCGLLEIIGHEVNFMHRTVFEYLSIPGVLHQGHLKVRDQEFDPHAVLAGIYLHAAWGNDERQLAGSLSYFGDMLTQCALAGAQAYDTISTVLWWFATLAKFGPTVSDENNHADKRSSPVAFNVSIGIALAVEAGMTTYVKTHYQLGCLGSDTTSDSPSLFYHALCKPYLSKMEIQSSRTKKNTNEMLRLLKDIGKDPSEAFTFKDLDGLTTWDKWIHGLSPTSSFALEITAVLLESSKSPPPLWMITRISNWTKSICNRTPDNSQMSGPPQPEIPLARRMLGVRVLKALEQFNPAIQPHMSCSKRKAESEEWQTNEHEPKNAAVRIELEDDWQTIQQH